MDMSTSSCTWPHLVHLVLNNEPELKVNRINSNVTSILDEQMKAERSNAGGI